VLQKNRTTANSNPEAKITLIRTSTMANIKGIIIPVNWDRNGNVISIAIATHDEDEIIVEGQRLIAQLKTLLREEVQVSGVLTRRGGRKSIKVETFSRKRNPSNINLYQS
jgi:hypothetical protein